MTRDGCFAPGVRLIASAVGVAVRGFPGLAQVLRECTIGEWVCLLRAYFWIAAVQGCLRLEGNGFASLAGLLDAVRRRRHRPAPARYGASQECELVYWSVEAAGLAFGDLTCLPAAAASFILLRRTGEPVTFVVGVCIDEDGALRAHAWVQRGTEALYESPLVPLVFSPVLSIPDPTAAPQPAERHIG